MPPRQPCLNCSVVDGVKKLLKEYETFLELSRNPRFVYMTDHARGNHHGCVRTIEDFISDLKPLVQFLADERDKSVDRKDYL